MVEELGEERAGKLIKYEGVASLTRVQATEILKTIWPGAPEIAVLKAAMICQQYGLSPLMKHVFLICFKRREGGKVVGEDWVTVLGINSNRLLAQRHHNYSYLDLTPRRMNDQEQEKVLGEVDDSRIWAITKIKDMENGAETMGVGSWPKDEVPYGTEKGNTKLNMACIRSERQALDRQYPGEMPQGVQVVDEEYVPIEGKSFISVPEGGKKTDESAGKSEQGEGDGGETAFSPPKITPKAKKSDAAAAVGQELFSPLPAEGKSPDEQLEGEGFHLDLQWLKEAQKELKWSDETLKTFLVQYKVSPAGSLKDVIKRLTRVQVEEFVEEIQRRVTEKQGDLSN